MNESSDLDNLPASAAPAHRLSNGTFTTLITGAGAGYSSYHGLALNRWSGDPAEGGEGYFIYLRDLDSGSFWSMGQQPVQRAAKHYEAQYRPGRFVLTRLDDGIEARMEVCVCPQDDLEIRRLVLRNHSDRDRRIEVTSYLEVVLNHPAAEAAHPAFSKLFVQTEFAKDEGTLIARRRPRSAGEHWPWLAQALVGPGGLQYETDRMRFLGRGRTAAEPVTLTSDAGLSGTVGNVLDPVFALRRVVELPPEGHAELRFLLAVAPERKVALALIRRYSDRNECERAFVQAEEHESALVATLGISGTEAGLGVDGALCHAGRSAASPAEKGERIAEGRLEKVAAGRENGEALQFFNGYGGFSAEGTEYVIRLSATEGGLRWPPLPWINVVSNEDFGFLVSESGAGYTWSRNSREHRLTPWSNDPVSDPHGEALYLRDEDTGKYWSPLPGPAPAGGDYEVRHGFGYTRFRHASHGLEQEACLFAPGHDPVKITRLSLCNRSGRPRRLFIFSYSRLVLGAVPADSARFITTRYDPVAGALFAVNASAGEFADGVTFAATGGNGGEEHFTCDRALFIGWNGSLKHPAALTMDRLRGEAGAGLDPCFAQQLVVELQPGESRECSFLLGETLSEAEARDLIERYRQPGAIEKAFAEIQSFWRELLGTIRIETPSPAIDLMVNGWLAYQNLSCRIWGRSAFYQSGGAFGYRDQLQDAAALVYLRPELTRAQILLHAAHQFVEGDVLHWWHPEPMERGLRTRFSDDLLWLPYVTAFYVKTTGDFGVLDERAPFVTAHLLDPGEDEAYLKPKDSGEAADIYEHCCRALDRSLTRGAHGLPLMGTGDWNDGMNRVGREGRGESVWMGFFLYHIFGEFQFLCERCGDAARIEHYRAYRDELGVALNEAGWDGAWYRRAYYDDGAPLGSKDSDECRIDALAQAWAVISRATPPERAAQAMDAVEEYLISDRDGLIRLLTPPFVNTPHDPGYIKGYVAGVRENGGQYTHAACWVVKAMAELGRNERAARLLEMLTPIHHTRTPEAVAVYQTEPYAVAADLYSEPPHVGRGGWSWYTGSAGWMYRVALESVLGFGLEDGNTITLKPCIPHDWRGFRLSCRLPDGMTRFVIEVNNPQGGSGVASARLDGQPLPVENGVARFPLLWDGEEHRAEVVLG